MINSLSDITVLILAAGEPANFLPWHANTRHHALTNIGHTLAIDRLKNDLLTFYKPKNIILAVDNLSYEFFDYAAFSGVQILPMRLWLKN